MENLKELIYELEMSLLSQDVRPSVEKLDQLIADDFIEYGSSGLVYDKKNMLERLPSSISPTYTLYDFEIKELSDSVVQTRFKTEKINGDGSKLTSLRSSIWKKISDSWQICFHQGTPTK